MYTLTAAASAEKGLTTTDPARVKRVMYRTALGLDAAYYVEVSVQRTGAPTIAYFYVVGASDGRTLFRNNLTADANQPAPTPYAYRVWADTTGARIPHDGPQGTAPTPHATGTPDGYQPPYVAPNLLQLGTGPISTKDPWLPAGATETIGNNVDAYADLVAPDGLTPASADRRATTNGPNTFDRVYNIALAPAANADQIQAAITQLFYTRTISCTTGFTTPASTKLPVTPNWTTTAMAASETILCAPRRRTIPESTMPTCPRRPMAGVPGCRCTCGRARAAPQSS